MRYPIAAAVVLGALAAGCTVTVDSHSEIAREEKRFSVRGIPEVRVATFDGSIQVQPWDRSEVVVEVEKRGPTREAIQGIQIQSTQNGDVIELEVKRPRNESFSGLGVHRTAYARLLVSLPRMANIRARSGDGGISIEGVSGRIELRTGDGSIRASDISGELTLDTGDGSVVVEGAAGKLLVDTGDGSVSVTGKLGVVKLHSGDGSIVYRAEPGSAMDDGWDITTGDGSVALFLPPDFGADLDAHTGDGRITSDLMSLEKTDGADERVKRTLRAKIGAGGKVLRVRTGDGAIRLKLN